MQIVFELSLSILLPNPILLDRTAVINVNFGEYGGRCWRSEPQLSIFKGIKFRFLGAMHISEFFVHPPVLSFVRRQVVIVVRSLIAYRSSEHLFDLPFC